MSNISIYPLQTIAGAEKEYKKARRGTFEKKTESMADWKSIGHWLNPQT
jgi:hypothetical protein